MLIKACYSDTHTGRKWVNLVWNDETFGWWCNFWSFEFRSPGRRLFIFPECLGLSPCLFISNVSPKKNRQL